ncbi:hypothetical protein AB3G33_01035 [Flavobacterium sp. WC2421]|uniref:hypothetical protein n=1 Tax=Flavobacterium sp. WC2421 TaxID=3234138 RepID=UPI00346577EA
MKTKIGVIFSVLFFQVCFAQNETRKPLHGQVVNDSLTLESGYVLNINSQTRTFINANGLFDILAKPKDTLLFSSLAFQSKKIVLTEKNCQERLFLVQMDLVNNELKEVVVSNGLKVNSLGGGSQRFVDKKFFDDEKSSPKNRLMPADGTIENGMDFVRIFKDFKKILRKKEEVKEDFISDVAFSEYVKVNFSPSFFSKDLSLKEDEVELFLLYCSNDAASKKYLKPEDRFMLMDFLITKNKEFKRIATFGK